jgi:hypothetical protein
MRSLRHVARALVDFTGVAAIITIAGIACGGGNSGDPPVTQEECEHLREHSLRVLVTSSTVSAEALERHRRQIRDASGEAAVERCVRELSRSQVRCAIGASTRAELNACVAVAPRVAANTKGS